MLARTNLRSILFGGVKSFRRSCAGHSYGPADSAIEDDQDDSEPDKFQVFKEEEWPTFPNVIDLADAISPIHQSTGISASELYADDEERNYMSILNASGISSFVFAKDGHCRESVLVVHPKIRWGAESVPKNTTSELQLEEAVTLCRTIPGFNVVGAVIVGTDYNTKKKTIWGEGRLYKLLNFKTQHNVSALMVNVPILTPLQQAELSAFFHVPVYDRYNIVLSIFKLYAKTREAHLQISLAEIPYIRHRLQYTNKNSDSKSVFSIVEGSADGNNVEEKLDALRLREHSLRKKIRAAVDAKAAECETRRSERNQAQRSCVIAVIGYTNAGKTTLIKKLTDSRTLHGENRLFATLDTTIHSAVLPSRLKVIFADTIGFISDLPIRLLASFSATLRHVVNADLLVHIQDLSHPNVVAQHSNVIETLRSLQISEELVNTMISVGNKIDRTSPAQLNRLRELPQFSEDHLLTISCRTGNGLPELIQRLDLNVQRISGSRPRRMKLPPTSKTIAYLYENGLVAEEPTVSECGKYLVFNVLMNDSQMAKFQANSGVKLRSAKSTCT